VRLTDCYAAAPNCSPSRAALLTGRFPYRVGIYDVISGPLHLSASETSVAALFSAAGYDTFFAGKWHLSSGPLEERAKKQPNPGDFGFARWLASSGSFDRDPTTLVRDGEPAGALEGLPSEILVRETIDWLERGRDRERPFLAFVWFHEVHEALRARPEFFDLYPDAAESAKRLAFGGRAVEREADPSLAAAYFAAVSQLDHEIGRLLERLEELGLAEDTFVFFTSDNGPEHRGKAAFGSPGALRGAKGFVHEGGIRVPGIARWPGRIPAGSRVSVPIHGVDLLPTLCSLAGIAPRTAKPLDGVDALPALVAGEDVSRATPLFWWFYRARGGKQVALREGNWKILARMVHPDQPTEGDLLPPEGTSFMDFVKETAIEDFELYDLTRDAAESNDLAETEPEKLEQLKTTLSALYAEVQAEAPVYR
jgi:arylsulfatase A